EWIRPSGHRGRHAARQGWGASVRGPGQGRLPPRLCRTGRRDPRPSRDPARLTNRKGERPGEPAARRASLSPGNAPVRRGSDRCRYVIDHNRASGGGMTGGIDHMTVSGRMKGRTMKLLRKVQGVQYELFDMSALDEMAPMVAEAFNRDEPMTVAQDV